MVDLYQVDMVSGRYITVSQRRYVGCLRSNNPASKWYSNPGLPDSGSQVLTFYRGPLLTPLLPLLLRVGGDQPSLCFSTFSESPLSMNNFYFFGQGAAILMTKLLNDKPWAPGAHILWQHYILMTDEQETATNFNMFTTHMATLQPFTGIKYFYLFLIVSFPY